jgi:hypothetical protein
MQNAWIPIEGEIAKEKKQIILKGKLLQMNRDEMIKYSLDPEKEYPLPGKVINSQNFFGGDISVDVCFTKASIYSACGIILYYDPSNGATINVEIGGTSESLFCLKTSDGKQTSYIHTKGDRDNLKSNIFYNIKANVNGSKIDFFVDEVKVISHVFPFTLPPSQVGVSWTDKSDIQIRDFKIQSKKPKVFVLLPFESPFEELYEDVIRKVCGDDLKLCVLKGDEQYGPGVIISDIESEIAESNIIIAEVTNGNPNVFYEVGFAKAINKFPILLAEESATLPFDISGFRTIKYQNSIHGKTKLESLLKKHVEAVLDKTLTIF